MKEKERSHQAIFNAIAKRMNNNDRKKMAVLYLLTADGTLWNIAKKEICHGKILLNRIRLRRANITSYTLLCCAKDIAYGTNFLTMADLSDVELIPQKVLDVIKRAISIRRYGLEYQPKQQENKNVKVIN